jgi:hypothetical protein
LTFVLGRAWVASRLLAAEAAISAIQPGYGWTHGRLVLAR